MSKTSTRRAFLLGGLGVCVPTATLAGGRISPEAARALARLIVQLYRLYQKWRHPHKDTRQVECPEDQDNMVAPSKSEQQQLPSRQCDKPQPL